MANDGPTEDKPNPVQQAIDDVVTYARERIGELPSQQLRDVALNQAWWVLRRIADDPEDQRP